MKMLKHVGRMKKNGAKILVAFRTIPGDPTHALVFGTSDLPDEYHNTVITLVESPQAQDVNEFGSILGIRYFPDGKPILKTLHESGRLIKVPTVDVLMTPNTVDSVSLDELNVLVAKQKGISLEDLAYVADENMRPEKLANEAPAEVVSAVEVNQTTDVGTLSASELRSRADALYKEAAKLRKQADELDPPKKKAVKAKETTVDA
jgi:hypothetical protein